MADLSKYLLPDSAATSSWLLEQIEIHGSDLGGRLARIAAEEYGGDGGWLLDMWEDVRFLVAHDLVAEKNGKYALTHSGRVQLHNLRSRQSTQESLAVAKAKLEVAVRALWITVALNIVSIGLTILLHFVD